MKTMYMHTINGKPAFFDAKNPGMICYIGKYGKAPALAGSLKEIYEQQRISVRTRHNGGFDIPNYGYVRVAVP